MQRLAGFVLGFGAVWAVASSAAAMCVENRSERNVAVVHGAPFNEMSQFYQTVVGPQGFDCAIMPLNAEGKTPVSIFVVDDRGRCQVASGCFYENGDEVNVFVGVGAKDCPTAFNVSNCPATAKK